MIKCNGRVEVQVEVRQDQTCPYKGHPPKRPCGKKAVAFFDVTFTSYRKRIKTQHKAIAGFCSECAKDKDRIYGWNDGNTKFWGVVDSVSTRSEPPPEVNKEDLVARQMKERIIDMMKQKNTERFSPEKWMEIFQDALNDHIVEGVMEG